MQDKYSIYFGGVTTKQKKNKIIINYFDFIRASVFDAFDTIRHNKVGTLISSVLFVLFLFVRKHLVEIESCCQHANAFTKSGLGS